MSMTDPIADLLTRIRNGQNARRVQVRIPASRVKESIIKVLKDEGYISDFVSESVGGKPVLTVRLKYHGGKPVIEELRRVSRPGLRVYRGKNELPREMNGLGIAIVSTSQGVMSDREARVRGQGGEVLCVIN